MEIWHWRIKHREYFQLIPHFPDQTQVTNLKECLAPWAPWWGYLCSDLDALLKVASFLPTSLPSAEGQLGSMGWSLSKMQLERLRSLEVCIWEGSLLETGSLYSEQQACCAQSCQALSSFITPFWEPLCRPTGNFTSWQVVYRFLL